MAVVSNKCSYDVSDYFFFKQKTAYEMRISDCISDVCSSDLGQRIGFAVDHADQGHRGPILILLGHGADFPEGARPFATRGNLERKVPRARGDRAGTRG